MLHFDTTDLRLFLAAATMESVGKAAEVIHLASSSASARLSELEKRVGVKLLARRSRGVVPTAAGVVFLRRAKELLNTVEALETEISPFRQRDSGMEFINIASNVNAMSTFLPRDLAAFMRDRPQAAVSVTKFHHNWELLNAVATGHADIGITGYAESHPDLAFFPYRTDRIAAVVPLSHPLASVNGTVPLANILDYELIALSNSALFDFVHEKSRAIGKPMKARLFVSSYREALEMALIGNWVTLAPCGTPIDESKLKRIVLSDDWAVRRLRICRRVDRMKATLLLDELADFLSKVGQQI